jgi:hypothetical protein
MFHVYVIVSESDPDRYYIGFSSRPDDRLTEHNADKNQSTAEFVPWRFAGISASLQRNRPDGSSATSKAVQAEPFFGVTFSMWILARDVLSS